MGGDARYTYRGVRCGGLPPLFTAAKIGDEETVVTEILNGADVNGVSLYAYHQLTRD